MRASVHALAGLLCLSACAHALTPDQETMVRRGDCAELLRAADAARAREQGGLASSLAAGCAQDKLNALVASAAPAEAMLWCGRAKAASGALAELGPAYNLGWEADEPDVIVGRVLITVDHATNSTVAQVADTKGGKQRVPAVQHRFIARAQGDVELAGKTRTIRATEEARDFTWDAAPRTSVAAWMIRTLAWCGMNHRMSRTWQAA